MAQDQRKLIRGMIDSIDRIILSEGGRAVEVEILREHRQQLLAAIAQLEAQGADARVTRSIIGLAVRKIVETLGDWLLGQGK